MSPRVYITQVPSRIHRDDSGKSSWMPTVDISGAKRYGEINVMLPPEANRLAVVPMVQALREQMRNFGREDYLLAMGDPTILAAAACIASLKTGGNLRMLKWDRQSTDYFPVEIKI